MENKIFWLIILLNFIEPLLTSPPEMNVPSEYVVSYVESITSLELICTGEMNITWRWNTSLPIEEVTIENFFNETTKTHKSVFKVDEILEYDTGFYKCFYGGKDPLKEEFVDVSYVYIQGIYPKFVYKGSKIIGTVNKEVFISCQVTTPDIPVRLRMGTGKYMDNDPRLNFDPHFGFIFRNLTLEDEDVYFCELNNVTPITFNLKINEETTTTATAEPTTTTAEPTTNITEPTTNTAEPTTTLTEPTSIIIIKGIIFITITYNHFHSKL